MLGISRISGGGEGYYIDAVAQGVDEYYRGVGEAPGWWAGTVADTELGLSDEVASEDLQKLWSGLDPRTGVKLGPFPNRKVSGFDLCWKAPKSVSLLFAFAPPEISRVVRDAHDASVVAAFDYLQEHAAGTRLGRGGAYPEKIAGFAAAVFRHRTSRTGDPHLHTRALIANIARAADGNWRTLDGGLPFQHLTTSGYLYQAHLRHELTERLGVEWLPTKKGAADMVGLDRSVILEFSERRRQIIEHLDEVGFQSARAAEIATLATRPDKPGPEVGSIRDVWMARAADVDFDPLSLAAMVGRHRPGPPTPEDVDNLFEVLASPEGLTKHDSTFDRRKVIRDLAAGLLNGAPAGDVEALADRFLQRSDVVALGPGSDITHSTCYSTKDLLQLEEQLVTSVIDRRGDQAGLATEEAVQAAIAARSTLGDEQAVMIVRLCRDGDGVAVVAAAAGTGKTFALAAAHDAWRASGFEVIGAAVAAKAAKGLEVAAGIPSYTLTKLNKDLAEGRVRFGPNTIAVIDESGMAGTRSLAPVLEAAERAIAEVVLVGDPKQLPEIEAGGMLNALTRLLDPITLNENRRQTEEWERDALAELRSGSVERALHAFEAHGRIVTGDTAGSIRTAMLDDWRTARDNGEQVVMLAIRHSEVDALNSMARRQLVGDGLVHGPELEGPELTFQAGDDILCLRNDYRLGVRNGDRGTIESVDPERRTMRAQFADRCRTLPSEYIDADHVTHAYATTIHKAQGMTVDRSLVLGTDDLYREAGYVALSRGRTANHLYAVGAPMIEDDLTHAPQQDEREPVDLLRAAFGQARGKQLAIEAKDDTAGPETPTQMTTRERLTARLDALERRPSGRDRGLEGPGIGL